MKNSPDFRHSYRLEHRNIYAYVSAKPRHKSEKKTFQGKAENVRKQISQKIVLCQKFIKNKSLPDTRMFYSDL